MTATNALLPAADRRVLGALFDAVLATGKAPPADALAASVGLSLLAVEERLDALTRADYLGRNRTGAITCLYPFSTVPTPHVVEIGDARRYAMCSIDALGIAAMLGRSVTIDGRCGACGAALRVGVEPGRIASAVPAETIVVARRSGAEQACEVCCPGTLFACGTAHGETLASRTPATEVVPLAEALDHAESIFADLMGEVLPARRPRSSVTARDFRT